ncbi:hypothetical protein CGCVW01_v001340 [Colletotrichum viniferum]|nr:hypothetical protein CGCVW01_v001340 [Colletotrichum viniferum]
MTTLLQFRLRSIHIHNHFVYLKTSSADLISHWPHLSRFSTFGSPLPRHPGHPQPTARPLIHNTITSINSCSQPQQQQQQQQHSKVNGHHTPSSCAKHVAHSLSSGSPFGNIHRDAPSDPPSPAGSCIPNWPPHPGLPKHYFVLSRPHKPPLHQGVENVEKLLTRYSYPSRENLRPAKRPPMQ